MKLMPLKKCIGSTEAFWVFLDYSMLWGILSFYFIFLSLFFLSFYRLLYFSFSSRCWSVYLLSYARLSQYTHPPACKTTGFEDLGRGPT